MDRLALVQRLAREGGVVQPDTTEGTLSEESQRLCDWIDQAWMEIQQKRNDWRWMRSSNILGEGASFTSVAGTASYTLGTGAGTVGVEAASFTKWVPDTFRNYTTSVGVSNEIFMDEIAYDVWRDSYMYGAMRSVTTRPVAIAIGPDNSLCVGPPPTAGYTFTADYYMAPSAMAATDAAEPSGMPAQFHMLIVYLAMTYLGAYETAPEVIDRGQGLYNQNMKRLEALQAPVMRGAGALA